MARTDLDIDGMNGDTPIWLKVTYRYGFPAAIAAFLVYFVTLGFASDIKSLKVDLHDHIIEQRYYLRAICINTSTDDSQRAQCYGQDR